MRTAKPFDVILFLLLLSTPVYADRTIRFPDEAIGTLSIRPEATADFGYKVFGEAYGSGWQEHRPAAGEVTIPDGFAVRLELNPVAAQNLDWLSEIPDDLIHALEARNVPLGDVGFEKLSRLVSLRHLSLSNAELTSAIADHLPRLRRLQYLWLGSNEQIGDEAMPVIAALPELQSIGLYGTGMTDSGLESLAKSSSIHAVYAGGTRITDAGLAAIAQLPNLRALNVLASNPKFRGDEPNPLISDVGLADLTNCPNLEHLSISGSELTDAGLEQLAFDCPNLKRLTMDNTLVTTQGLRHLGSFTQLEDFRCYGTTLDDSVVPHFRGLNKLRRISGDIKVGSASVRLLAELPSLESLSLSRECDDASMALVAAMPSLKELSLQHTHVTDEGFELLADSTTLEHVQITGNRMTTRCIETLATMPNLKRVGLMNVRPRDDGEPIWKGLEGLQSLEREFWIVDCPPLEYDDFAKLAKFQNLSQLRIDGGRPLTDADLQHLRNLDQLEYLELTSTAITDEGLEALSGLPLLERLQINCLATETGLETLARAPRLRYVTIGSPNLTDEIIQQVQAKHPRLTNVRRMEFRFGGVEVSRSKTTSDDFWRKGSEEEREELNALEGAPAPELVMTDWINAEQQLTLSNFRGQVVLVEFWGTWCGPCLARMPKVRQLNEEFADRGLVVIGVHSTRAAEEAAEYVASNNLSWAIGLDDDNQSSTGYAVPHWPSFYLIDRSGVLRMANPYDDDLKAAIEFLLEE